MFMQSEKGILPKDPAGEISSAVSDSVLKHFELRYGLNFGEPLPSAKKLQYLAALIHFAKLRRALLTEYGI